MKRVATIVLALVALLFLGAGSLAGVQYLRARSYCEGLTRRVDYEIREQQLSRCRGTIRIFRGLPHYARLNPRLGPTVVVASGEADGRPWELIAYEAASGLCVEVRDIGPKTSSGGGCGFDVPLRRHLAVILSRGSLPQTQWVHGPVSRKVAKVRLVLSNGRTLELRPVGTDSPFNVNFYGAALPISALVEAVVAVDIQGREIDRQPVEG